MSQYIEFFAAPSDAAAAAVRTKGPALKYAFVDANDIYFDADDAVIAWRDLLTGRAGLHLSEQDDLRMVADFVNDGSAVFALLDELVTSLVEASARRLRDVAGAWVPAVAQTAWRSMWTPRWASCRGSLGSPQPRPARQTVSTVGWLVECSPWLPTKPSPKRGAGSGRVRQ